MSISHWEVVHNSNFSHGVDFAEGLLEGEYCYAIKINATPALISIKNNNLIDFENIKLVSLIRKTCDNLEPFLLVRLDNTTKFAYILKLETNLNLYKIKIDDLASFSSVAPLDAGNTQLLPNVTYKVAFSCYTILDGSTVLDAYLYINNTWVNDIKKIIPQDLVSGDFGFGVVHKFVNIQSQCSKVYFDTIEIYKPIQFI